jgi:bud site selection protein 31
MPKIRTSRTKPPPEGFEDIQLVSAHSRCYDSGLMRIRDILEDYEKKMRDAESESHEGKRRVESVWYVITITFKG